MAWVFILVVFPCWGLWSLARRWDPLPQRTHESSRILALVYRAKGMTAGGLDGGDYRRICCGLFRFRRTRMDLDDGVDVCLRQLDGLVSMETSNGNTAVRIALHR